MGFRVSGLYSPRLSALSPALDSPATRLLELGDALLERRFDVVVPVRLVVRGLDPVAVIRGEVRMQAFFERQDLADRQVVEEALLCRIQRDRELRDRQRRV